MCSSDLSGEVNSGSVPDFINIPTGEEKSAAAFALNPKKSILQSRFRYEHSIIGNFGYLVTMMYRLKPVPIWNKNESLFDFHSVTRSNQSNRIIGDRQTGRAMFPEFENFRTRRIFIQTFFYRGLYCLRTHVHTVREFCNFHRELYYTVFLTCIHL